MKIGILKEGKVPADKRTPFTPEQCRAIEQSFPGTKVYVQKSDVRCFSNEEYQKQGISIVDNVDDCDVLFGVKEVPTDNLIAGKKYMFFSHTIKKTSAQQKINSRNY